VRFLSSLSFLTSVELYITNSFTSVKLWSNISIQMFWGVCEKICGENCPKSGALEIGFFATKMLPLILLCMCWKFLPRNSVLLLICILLISTAGNLHFFPQISSWHWREEIWWRYQDSKTTAGYISKQMTSAIVSNNDANTGLAVLRRGQHGISVKKTIF
jgi:hypothetical protein